MVLLEIHAEGISGIEFKGIHHAPWTWTVLTRGNETFEGMKIKPRKRHPVEVTYHGRPELIVMSVEDYQLLRRAKNALSH